MRVLDIMLKDLVQILQDKKSLLFLLLMPVVFTFFIGVVLKGNSTPQDPRLSVGWINDDPDGMVSNSLHEILSSSDSVRLVDLAVGSEADANQQVAAGKLAAALVVPQGFSTSVLAGKTSQIIMLSDPMSNTGQSALQIVRVPVTRIMSAVEIARLNSNGDPQALQASYLQAVQLWKDSGKSGPQIVISKAEGKKGLDLAANPYNQSSPGIMVMFAIFSLTTSATILVQERKSRTLDRMLTTSLSRAQIIAGHLLAMFILVLAQQLILVVFGQFALHVDYLRLPLGSLLVMVALSLWVASMGLMVSVLAKGEEQVILFAMLAMFILSALGGAWFPLEGAGKAFTTIGKLTPGAWAMTGFQNILVRGLDTSSVLLPVAAQLLFALAFFLLGVWRFSKQS